MEKVFNEDSKDESKKHLQFFENLLRPEDFQDFKSALENNTRISNSDNKELFNNWMDLRRLAGQNNSPENVSVDETMDVEDELLQVDNTFCENIDIINLDIIYEAVNNEHIQDAIFMDEILQDSKQNEIHKDIGNNQPNESIQLVSSQPATDQSQSNQSSDEIKILEVIESEQNLVNKELTNKNYVSFKGIKSNESCILMQSSPSNVHSQLIQVANNDAIIEAVQLQKDLTMKNSTDEQFSAILQGDKKNNDYEHKTDNAVCLPKSSDSLVITQLENVPLICPDVLDLSLPLKNSNRSVLQEIQNKYVAVTNEAEVSDTPVGSKKNIATKLNVPAPFKKALAWPEEIPKKKKKNTRKIPTVLTSEDWQAHHLQIQEAKNKKEIEKEERRRHRKTAKIQKEKEKEAKKAVAQEAKKINDEIKKLLLQKKQIKQEKL